MVAPTLAVLLVSCALGLALTLAVRGIARRVGLTDRPDGHRKLQEQATPLGGGVAVYVTTALMVTALWYIPSPWQAGLQEYGRELLGMLLGGAVIVAVGLLDDRVRLRGRHKLMGQLLAVLILVTHGVGIERLGILGHEFELGILAVPFTFFWLLGAINSINLLDGIDGLATTLGVILVATFAIIAFMIGRPEIALVAVIFAGSLLGFMWFNFPPASIYLGDAGSMLIGLVVGVLAVQGSMKGPGTRLLAAPLAVWTLPIFDSATAILRRKLTGRSIFATDRGHLHHELLHRFGSNVRVLAVVAACCGLTSAAALVSIFFKSDAVALLVGLALVGVFIVTGIFGRAEFMLLVGRSRNFGRSYLRLPGKWSAEPTHSAVHLQGSGRWDKIWAALTESAEKLSVRQMSLDVNVPMLHEGFNAAWNKPCQYEVERYWRIEVPLLLDGHLIGRLCVVADAAQDSKREDIGLLLDLFDTCESYLESIIEEQIMANAVRHDRVTRRRPRERLRAK